jgi:Tat protein secretion system quality control protein TatD with DNase activity
MMRELDNAVINMPDSSILLETDSPYIRFDGDRMPNTSLTLYDVAKRVASMKDMTIKQVADVAAENFSRLFNIDIKE